MLPTSNATSGRRFSHPCGEAGSEQKKKKREEQHDQALLADRASFEHTGTQFTRNRSRGASTVHRCEPRLVLAKYETRGYHTWWCVPPPRPSKIVNSRARNRGNQTMANVWSRFSLSSFHLSLPSIFFLPPLSSSRFFLLRGSSRCAQVRASILSRSAFLRVRARGRRRGRTRRGRIRRREDRFLSLSLLMKIQRGGGKWKQQFSKGIERCPEGLRHCFRGDSGFGEV